MIYITLTEKGYENIDQVLEATFSYLLLLETSGPNREYYEKLQLRSENDFKFMDEKSALSNVSTLSNNMGDYAHKDIMTGSKLYMEYNEDEIRSIISLLNEKKFNILIVSDKYQNFDKKEKWFGTEYAEIGEFYRKFPLDNYLT